MGAIHAYRSFLKQIAPVARRVKKSDWAKIDKSDSLLGIKREENCQKILKIQFFGANCSFLRSIRSDLLLFRAMRAICSHMLFYQKRPERSAHGWPLIWAILSERVKSEFPSLLIKMGVGLTKGQWPMLCMLLSVATGVSQPRQMIGRFTTA